MDDGFDELIAAAAAVDVSGWDFSWLDGRATEERPRWGYQRLMGEKIGRSTFGLDIQTGGGEVLAGVPQRAAKAMVATESWPPNNKRAQENLRSKGVVVVGDEGRPPLPFADDTFDLVTSRHPVTVHWDDIAHVLAPGGTYFSQQVGPDSGHEIYDFFLGPQPLGQTGREPVLARRGAEQAPEGPPRADPERRPVRRLLPPHPDRGAQAGALNTGKYVHQGHARSPLRWRCLSAN